MPNNPYGEGAAFWQEYSSFTRNVEPQVNNNKSLNHSKQFLFAFQKHALSNSPFLYRQGERDPREHNVKLN